jgi:hypothetical protein
MDVRLLDLESTAFTRTLFPYSKTGGKDFSWKLGAINKERKQRRKNRRKKKVRKEEGKAVANEAWKQEIMDRQNKGEREGGIKEGMRKRKMQNGRNRMEK